MLVIWPSFRGLDFIGTLHEIDPNLLEPLETVVLYGEDDAHPVCGRLGKRPISYAELAKASPVAVDLGSSTLGSNVFTTSGTTTVPKCVLHSQRAIVTHASWVAKAAASSTDSVQLLCLPLCGIVGFVQAMAALASGSCSVMQASFDEKAHQNLFGRTRQQLYAPRMKCWHVSSQNRRNKFHSPRSSGLASEAFLLSYRIFHRISRKGEYVSLASMDQARCRRSLRISRYGGATWKSRGWWSFGTTPPLRFASATSRREIGGARHSRGARAERAQAYAWIFLR